MVTKRSQAWKLTKYMTADTVTPAAMKLNMLLYQLKNIYIYNDEQVEILVTDHPGNHHRRKHINTKIYGVRDAVLNGDE